MLKGKRIFITGGAGFIGSTLARLLHEGNEICLYDNLRRGTNSKLADIMDQLTLIEGDVLDAEAFEKAMIDFKPTHVVHAAAIAGIDTVSLRPADTLEINSLGTANALRAAKKVHESIGLERVVCFSTSEIFGPNADNVDEKSPAVVGAVGEPRWVYAVSKLYSEHMAFAYYKQYGLPTACVRPFNVYGPGQVGEGALANFTKNALQGKPLEIRGAGDQVRAWCYVDDMVDAVMLCLEHDNAVGKAFNVGHSASAITIKDLAAKIVEITGSDSEIVHTDGMSADVYMRVPDTKYPEQEIGFKAKVGLDEGLKNAAAYYAEQLGLK